jgi:hypothetical protein
MDIGIGGAKHDTIIASHQVIAIENIATGFDEKVSSKQRRKVPGCGRAQGRKSGLLISDVAACQVDANGHGSAQKNN